MKSHAFSALTVCGLDELDDHAARGVTHVLSIFDRNGRTRRRSSPSIRTFEPFCGFTMRSSRAPGVVLPARSDVETILAFGRDAGDVTHLLIHCHAGISRSTAAMLMILAQAHPGESEDAVVERLLAIRPQAWPNSRMIGFADELLNRNGRLLAAVVRIYARRLKIHPELADVMRRLNRGREVELGLRQAA